MISEFIQRPRAMQALRLGCSVLTVLVAGGLGACSTPVRLDPLPPVENRAPATSPAASAATSAQALPTAQSRVASVDLGRNGAGGATASGLAPLGGVTGRPLGGAGGNTDAGGSALAAGDARVVYFDFDSFAVREDYQPIIASQARRLSADRNRKLLLEGHTDERGGREYNLALGQRRAEAAKRLLMLMGAREVQIESVSLGEEKPRCEDKTEACFGQNRRSDMLHSGEF
jgi:peptidoglycan-associated lipoprotein